MTADWNKIPARTRAALRRRVFARDHHQCQIRGPDCTGKAEELDHIVPRSLGGSLTALTNLRAACGVCNGQRGVATAHQVRERNARASVEGPSREW